MADKPRTISSEEYLRRTTQYAAESQAERLEMENTMLRQENEELKRRLKCKDKKEIR